MLELIGGAILLLVVVVITIVDGYQNVQWADGILRTHNAAFVADVMEGRFFVLTITLIGFGLVLDGWRRIRNLPNPKNTGTSDHAMVGLRIVKAEWGIDDHWQDVTTALRSRVSLDRLDVAVIDESFVKTPHLPGYPKFIKVLYSLNGQPPREVIKEEGAHVRLTIPELPTMPGVTSAGGPKRLVLYPEKESSTLAMLREAEAQGWQLVRANVDCQDVIAERMRLGQELVESAPNSFDQDEANRWKTAVNIWKTDTDRLLAPCGHVIVACWHDMAGEPTIKLGMAPLLIHAEMALLDRRLVNLRALLNK
jgi:hypothetical protein